MFTTVKKRENALQNGDYHHSNEAATFISVVSFDADFFEVTNFFDSR